MNRQNKESEAVLVSPAMSNREMAAYLFNIATVLKQAGNANPYRTAAYERGARAMMGLRREARDVLAEGSAIPFRRRQHIGVGLQAKIREMAEAGALAQYEAMLQELPPHIADLMRVPGVGPITAQRIYAQIGVATARDMVLAARDGRLRSVWGMGKKRIAKIAALALPDASERNTAPLRTLVAQPCLFDYADLPQ